MAQANEAALPAAAAAASSRRIPARALFELFKAEFILYWREPFGFFFTLIFPSLLLLLFGSIFGGEEIGGGFRVVDFYTPGLLAMVIANIGLMGLPLTLANYREEGILKRYQVSPLPLWGLFGVHLAVNAAMFLVGAVIVIAVGFLVFQVPLTANYGGLLVAVLLGLLSFCAVGLALASVTSSVRTVQAVGNLLFFIMFFTSGLSAPREMLPGWMQPIANQQPMARLVDMFAGLWMNATLGDFVSTILILLALTVVCWLIVVRTFRWQA